MILASSVEGRGDTPPIVLLHSLALDRSMWASLATELSRDRIVIGLDLRGHGESPKQKSFSIEDMADDVAATIDELGHDRAIVVGLSLGGCVAQAFAIRHPDRLAGLGLIDTTAWYGPDAPERWAERATKARQQGMASLAQFQLDRWFAADFIDANRDEVEALLQVFTANDIDSYAASCHALGQFDARGNLGEIRAQTVVLVGELDPATPPEHARDLATRLPLASLHVLAGAKHLTPVELPGVVADLLSPLWADDAGQPMPGDRK